MERGVDQGSDPVTRLPSSKADDGDSSRFRLESTIKAEIAKITDKGGRYEIVRLESMIKAEIAKITNRGLINTEGVEKLVHLIQLDRSGKKIGMMCQLMVADVVAATDRFDCLERFVQLMGVSVLDDWLQEAQKGKVGDGSNPKERDISVEELLFAILVALDKLPVNLHALQICNVGESVNHLCSHKNLDIQKKARSLIETWKKRVEAELNGGVHLKDDDDRDSSHFRMESMIEAEIAEITDKRGLINSLGVEKLVRLMQRDGAEKKIDMMGRIMVANVVAATDRFECLDQFVQLRGVSVLDDWLQEARKGKVGDGSNPKERDISVEELLFAILVALDKLPVNLHALQICNVGKSVNHLGSHKNLDIQKKARSLIETWKKRVEAELNGGVHLKDDDDRDSSHFRMESMIEAEIAEITDKRGLINSLGVEKLVHLMQRDGAEKKIDMMGRIMVANVVAATDRFECLDQFVQLRGVSVLDDWLQEARKGKVGDGSNPKERDISVEELLIAILVALDKLPVNLHTLQTCNIGKSVNLLRSHKNLEIQKKARSLIGTWKKRVEAEMMINEVRGGVYPTASR